MIHVGSCLDVLPTFSENSIDACVTDPPYHLTSIIKRFGSDTAAPAQYGQDGAYARASAGFMGQKWDGGDVAFRPETWAQVYRVLKPGAHLVAFGGTRTYHRMACAIEDAGFEVRDCIMWLYGSGFPKSHDVSKGIDRAAGTQGTYGEPKSAAHAGWIKRGRMRGANGHEGYQRPWMADKESVSNNARRYEPATDAARQWDGWGTALKPACEPIVLARKPLSEKTVAANVLRWGTGAINVDECRIDGPSRKTSSGGMGRKAHPVYGNFANSETIPLTTNTGRWPANVCHDGSDEVVREFPRNKSPEGYSHRSAGTNNCMSGPNTERYSANGYGDSGSAARFFYCAKASRADRGPDNKHPTVKPTKLMQWLCRMITPPRGLILDPFTGSGSTGRAAALEGFDFVGIEMETEYAEIAKRRIAAAQPEPDLLAL